MIKLTMDFGMGGQHPCWIAVQSIAAIAPAQIQWGACVETHGGGTYHVIESPEQIVKMVLELLPVKP